MSQVVTCNVARGGGRVVSALAFYSNVLISNRAEVYSFDSLKCLNRTKIRGIEAEDRFIKY